MTRSTFFAPRLESLERRLAPDASYFGLRDAGFYWQDWSDTGLLSQDNNWSGVPSVVGYRGDGLTGSAGADPQTVLASAGPGGPVVNVLADRTDPDALTTGGVAVSVSDLHAMDDATKCALLAEINAKLGIRPMFPKG